MGKANNNPFPSEVVFLCQSHDCFNGDYKQRKKRRNAIKYLMERCSRIMSQRKIKKLVIVTVKCPVKSGNDFCYGIVKYVKE